MSALVVREIMGFIINIYGATILLNPKIKF